MLTYQARILCNGLSPCCLLVGNLCHHRPQISRLWHLSETFLLIKQMTKNSDFNHTRKQPFCAWTRWTTKYCKLVKRLFVVDNLNFLWSFHAIGSHQLFSSFKQDGNVKGKMATLKWYVHIIFRSKLKQSIFTTSERCQFLFCDLLYRYSDECSDVPIPILGHYPKICEASHIES